jgi:hypothetical protein
VIIQPDGSWRSDEPEAFYGDHRGVAGVYVTDGSRSWFISNECLEQAIDPLQHLSQTAKDLCLALIGRSHGLEV